MVLFSAVSSPLDRSKRFTPCIPHCPTHPESCSCLSPVDFVDRLCLLQRVEDRQRGDRTSVYDHQHVVVDERVPSGVRPAVYAGVSPPSHRPLAVIHCHNSTVSRLAFDSPAEQHKIWRISRASVRSDVIRLHYHSQVLGPSSLLRSR